MASATLLEGEAVKRCSRRIEWSSQVADEKKEADETCFVNTRGNLLAGGSLEVVGPNVPI